LEKEINFTQGFN